MSKSQTQPDGGEPERSGDHDTKWKETEGNGNCVALLQRLSDNGGLKEAAQLRQGNAECTGRRTEIESGEFDWDHGADSVDFETVLSPLSIF